MSLMYLLQNGVSDEDLLKKFNIKPCYVDLSNSTFFKIKVSCSFAPEDDVQLQSYLLQTSSNNFKLKISRTPFNDKIDDSSTAKRLKLTTSEPSGNVKLSCNLLQASPKYFTLEIDQQQNDKIDSSVAKRFKLVTTEPNDKIEKSKKGTRETALQKKGWKVSHVTDVSEGDVVMCKMRGS